MKSRPKLGCVLIAGMAVCGLVASIAVVSYIIFGLGVYLINQQGMLPTYAPQDRVLVDKLFFRMGGLQRGDVVMLRNPDDVGVIQIKRVVALPGEQVEIHDGRVFINGEPLDEPYLSAGTVTNAEGGRNTGELGAQEYFMLGDNRPASGDSRQHGPVTMSNIVGRVLTRYASGAR